MSDNWQSWFLAFWQDAGGEFQQPEALDVPALAQREREVLAGMHAHIARLGARVYFLIRSDMNEGARRWRSGRKPSRQGGAHCNHLSQDNGCWFSQTYDCQAYLGVVLDRWCRYMCWLRFWSSSCCQNTCAPSPSYGAIAWDFLRGSTFRGGGVRGVAWTVTVDGRDVIPSHLLIGELNQRNCGVR